MPTENDLIQKLKKKIKGLCKDKKFKHYQWFLKFHLEIVEKISLELCEIYNERLHCYYYKMGKNSR